jgi:hypothetical protein
MKTNKIVFWVATGLLSAMLLMSAIYMYIINHDTMAVVAFENLGFPTWIIYPLAIAKILGVIAITTRKSAKIKEWAYAGFFFNFVLAASAHLAVGDGEHWGAIIALVLLIVSYVFGEKMAKEA